MNKKRNRYKNIFELTKRLLGFIQLFKQTLFFIFIIIKQARQRCNYLKITIYKKFIKVNKF